MKVSVIIPNYNRANIVGETIENTLCQSLSPHEVIVVDDGSTDSSVEILRSFGDRITLIQQSNQGPGAARNAGLKRATGESIQFMDSDDLVSLNKLEVQAQALIEQNADIAYGPWVKAWMDKRRIQPENVVLQQRPLPAGQHPLCWFLTGWSMVFQQCLVRRSALAKIGGYRDDMRLYEDGELLVRLLLSGAKLVHEADSLTFYRLEDYGKLTASGKQNSARAIDTARFYSLVIQQLQDHPQHQDILDHINFRASVWSAWHSLAAAVRYEDLSAEIKVDIERLKPYGTEGKLKLWVWWQQKQQGLQQRWCGHRWPACYQTGRVTPSQNKLIQAIGPALS